MSAVVSCSFRVRASSLNGLPLEVQARAVRATLSLMLATRLVWAVPLPSRLSPLPI